MISLCLVMPCMARQIPTSPSVLPSGPHMERIRVQMESASP